MIFVFIFSEITQSSEISKFLRISIKYNELLIFYILYFPWGNGSIFKTFLMSKEIFLEINRRHGLLLVNVWIFGRFFFFQNKESFCGNLAGNKSKSRILLWKWKSFWKIKTKITQNSPKRLPNSLLQNPANYFGGLC